MREKYKPTTKLVMLSWVVLLLATMFVLYLFLLQSSTSIMMRELMDDFHLSITEVGILSSSFLYPYLLGQVPSGIIVDKYGPRRTLIGAVGLCTAASFVFAYAKTFQTAEIARIVMGFSSAPGFVSAMYLGARWFPRRYFPLVAGIVEMIGMIGGALGELLLAHGVHTYGWRFTFVLCGFGALVLFFLTLTTIRDQPKHSLKKFLSSVSPDSTREPMMKSFAKLLAKPQVWYAGFYTGLMFTVITGFASLWAIPYLQTLYRTDTTTAALLSAFIFFGTALGAPVLGWIAKQTDRYRFLMISTSVTCFCLALLVIYTSQWWHIGMVMMGFLLFLFGASCSAYVLPFAFIKKRAKRAAHGAAIGYTNMMCIFFGGPILQPLIGWILDNVVNPNHPAHDLSILNVTDYQIGFVPFLFCIGCAVIVAFRIRDD